KDPYVSIKKKHNQLALQFYDEAKNIIEKAEDPLFEAIAVAALGNTIDLGTHHKIDFINDIKTFTPDNLTINDYELFKQSLQDTNHLLILLDNAGEIVFDRLLLEELPPKRVTLALRGSPVINDATVEDAEYTKLDGLVKIIDNGSDVPGTILKVCSERFHQLFEQADLVIAKGQGNYETLSEEAREIFFLLKVKCPVIARDIGCEPGALVVLEKRSSPD
ncbi:MAG: DUF89 family protein, partial [candidate division Zixibacteria bacterium]|nr:DUF89 family protein [candidate division Zixibacteria bacterium]